MNTYKWFFLIVIASVLISCAGESEDELIGDWQKRASFTLEPRSYAATFVIGDKGYVCCGSTGSRQGPVKHVLVFDHTTPNGSWSVLKSFPGPAREKAVGFSLKVKGKDYGFIGTGWNGYLEKLYKDFWCYDPEKEDTEDDAWIEVAPLPKNGYPRRGAIAFSLKVGDKEYGYVGFGWTGDLIDEEVGNLYLADLYRFDPEGTTVIDGQTYMGEWEVVKGYGGDKRLGAAVFIIENAAYICTGENPSSPTGYAIDFWKFDPDGERKGNPLWTGTPTLRPMAETNKDEDYDDDYGTLKRMFGSAYVVKLPDGQGMRGHIVGGSPNSQTWEYDHINDLWIQRTTFINNSGGRSAREGMIAFTFKTSGRAFIGMGRSGSKNYEDMWEFIPLIEDEIHTDI